MDKKIHSVRLEEKGKDPGFRGLLKAAFLVATGKCGRARSIISGEQWLVARNAAGEIVFGISGANNMTIYVDRPLDETTAQSRADKSAPAGAQAAGTRAAPVLKL